MKHSIEFFIISLIFLILSPAISKCECYLVGVERSNRIWHVSIFDTSANEPVTLKLENWTDRTSISKIINPLNKLLLDKQIVDLDSFSLSGNLTKINKLAFCNLNKDGNLLIIADDKLNLIELQQDSIIWSMKKPAYTSSIVQTPDTKDVLVILNKNLHRHGGVAIIDFKSKKRWLRDVGWDPVGIYIGGPGPYAYVVCEGDQQLTILDYHRKMILDRVKIPMEAKHDYNSGSRTKNWSKSVITPDGNYLFLIAGSKESKGRSFFAYDLRYGKPKDVSNRFPRELYSECEFHSAVVSPDSKRLMLYYNKNVFMMLDVNNGKILCRKSVLSRTSKPWMAAIFNYNLNHYKKLAGFDTMLVDYFEEGIGKWTVTPEEWQPLQKQYGISPQYSLVFTDSGQSISYKFPDMQTDICVGFAFLSVPEREGPVEIEFTNQDNNFSFKLLNDMDPKNYYYYLGKKEFVAERKKKSLVYRWIYFYFSNEGCNCFIGTLDNSANDVKKLFNIENFRGFTDTILKSNSGDWKEKFFIIDNFTILKPKRLAVDLYFPFKGKESWVKINKMLIK